MLSVNNISFGYNDQFTIKDISFSVEKGQNISVIGASGCGKSTLLKLIYGLLHPNKGTIYWNDQKLLGPNYHLIPGESFMKYLSQDFDLMPYITVEENVGAFLSNFYPEKKMERTRELLEILELTPFARTKTRYLSGGQQQRVALARVLAVEPEILLLDEPFSHIDNFRKNALRRNLFSFLKKKGISCIVATHDSTDALSFADETIVLREGNMIAKDKPVNLYQKPDNRYIASLFGEVNEIAVSLLIPFEDPGKKVLLYPHELKYTMESDFKVTVKKSYFKGSRFLIKAAYEHKVLFFEHPTALNENDTVSLKVSENLIRNRIA
ncbi:ATP-binding cassette domain-containing protein [Leptobacterium flavescens]|uniref:ATP-binding cassette domain-containing protein n=1 Tax=Leptobacterium flavescens TaxID=472055 RepID=A0A6P0UP42_9FLAO|nr:ABC transporter ATP-binding protein [Leptobacterium flavescens]NER14262.1 ATP-binding cassette domain-containing protein [Leptobacterium flavescens]